VAQDELIDRLERQLTNEVIAYMSAGEQYHAAGLLLSRCGRELERVGDLMCNVAEDVVYLSSGQIIRHEGKPRSRPPA
jgi:phosphate transport system protein